MMVYSRQEKGVLHATEALHDFCVTCNISTSGFIFSEFVSFDFSVEGHAIHAQQAGCLCFVPAGVIEDFKNCGRAVLDSGSAHEVRRKMTEGDDVLAAQDERMLPGVLELPPIAGPGDTCEKLSKHQRITLYRFLEYDGNTCVACNTISIQVHIHRRVSSFRKCL
jgi:hypothetical protein